MYMSEAVVVSIVLKVVAAILALVSCFASELVFDKVWLFLLL